MTWLGKKAGTGIPLNFRTDRRRITDRISYFREKTDSGKNSGKNGENRIEIGWGIFPTEFSVPVFIFRLDSSPLALPAHKPAKLLPAAIAPSAFSWWAGLLAFIANLSCPLRSADEVGLNLDQLAAWLLHACRCARERLCAVLSCNGPQGPGGQQQHVLTKPRKRKLAEQVYFYISFFLNDYLLSFFFQVVYALNVVDHLFVWICARPTSQVTFIFAMLSVYNIFFTNVLYMVVSCYIELDVWSDYMHWCSRF